MNDITPFTAGDNNGYFVLYYNNINFKKCGEITMEENQRKPELHSLPFIVHSSYKFRMHVLYLFMITMFVGFSFIPVNDLSGIFFRVLLLVFGIFFAYIWFYTGVMKKAYIKLTEDEILFKTLFGIKKLKWTDIANVQTYYKSNNSFIGIISKEKLENQKDNFFTSISNLYGGVYSLSIPLQSFSTAEPEKLYATIFYTLQEKYQQQCNEEEISNDIIENKKDEKLVEGSAVTALFKTLIVSMISGVIYGVLTYLLKVNFLIIPMLGFWGIYYVYFKNYKEKGFNIVCRFFLGALCALQFFVALLVVLIMLNSNLIEANGLWRTISDCIVIIVKHPEKNGIYYYFAIIFFFIGVFSGYSSKITRRMRKIFIHKQNGFYIKREKRYVSIYLTDYAEYNENEKKIVLSINPNICLIEKEKKNILAFYISEEVVDSFNIDAKNFARILTNEKMYFKLDLGGNGEPKLYGYSCLLILNMNRQVEVIKLETD